MDLMQISAQIMHCIGLCDNAGEERGFQLILSVNKLKQKYFDDEVCVTSNKE